MASEAKAKPTVVGELLLIEVAEIEMGERLRPIDKVWAKALGGMMVAEGQDEAIKVCRLPGRTNYRLVAGGHRLVGAALAGMTYIKAEVVTNDELARRAIEVRENLFKKGLDPLDRAAFVAELITLKKLEAGVDPNATSQQIAIQARWQKQLSDDAADAEDIVSSAYGFTENVAEDLGFSSRTIIRDLFLHRRLLPDVSARLRSHAICRNAGQLKALAKLSETEQREIAGMLAEGTVKSVAEAVATIKQTPKASAEDKRFSTIIGTLGRMSDRERGGVLAHIAALYHPDGRRRAKPPSQWVDPATGGKWFRYEDGSYGDELFQADAVDSFPSWDALQAACQQ